MVRMKQQYVEGRDAYQKLNLLDCSAETFLSRQANNKTVTNKVVGAVI